MPVLIIFQVVTPDNGKSFQLAIVAPPMLPLCKAGILVILALVFIIDMDRCSYGLQL